MPNGKQQGTKAVHKRDGEGVQKYADEEVALHAISARGEIPQYRKYQFPSFHSKKNRDI